MKNFFYSTRYILGKAAHSVGGSNLIRGIRGNPALGSVVGGGGGN